MLKDTLGRLLKQNEAEKFIIFGVKGGLPTQCRAMAVKYHRPLK